MYQRLRFICPGEWQRNQRLSAMSLMNRCSFFFSRRLSYGGFLFSNADSTRKLVRPSSTSLTSARSHYVNSWMHSDWIRPRGPKMSSSERPRQCWSLKTVRGVHALDRMLPKYFGRRSRQRRVAENRHGSNPKATGRGRTACRDRPDCEAYRAATLRRRLLTARAADATLDSVGPDRTVRALRQTRRLPRGDGESGGRRAGWRMKQQQQQQQLNERRRRRSFSGVRCRRVKKYLCPSVCPSVLAPSKLRVRPSGSSWRTPKQRLPTSLHRCFTLSMWPGAAAAAAVWHGSFTYTSQSVQQVHARSATSLSACRLANVNRRQNLATSGQNTEVSSVR